MTVKTDDAALRALHEAWFEASTRKDLDATMALIAPDIVSFEHGPPLQMTSLEEVREECRKGMEYQTHGFKWTVPDLQVRVEGDLAVAWGLNRMASKNKDGTESVMWSRGTRVFVKRDGAWKMVHQHVSFPVDPESNAALTELVP